MHNNNVLHIADYSMKTANLHIDDLEVFQTLHAHLQGLLRKSIDVHPGPMHIK